MISPLEDQLVSLYGHLNTRLQQQNAIRGRLNVALMWHDISDLDLHVKCPCDTLIYYARRKCDKCGGQLDVDMNRNANELSENPVENVFWTNPPGGRYQIQVVNYHNRLDGRQPSQFQVTVTLGTPHSDVYRSRVFNGFASSREPVVVFNDMIEQLLNSSDHHSQHPIYDLTKSAGYDPCLPPLVEVVDLCAPPVRDRTMQDDMCIDGGTGPPTDPFPANLY